MTIYALVRDGHIEQVGALPRLWDDGSRWWDMRDGTPAPGWEQVEAVPRPDDTDTTTHDLEYTVEGGVAVQRWTPRPWTAAEQASRAEQSARLDGLTARITRIEAHLWPAPDDPTTPDDPTVADWAALGGVWPNEGLLREGGIIWRNVSGVPLTTPPSGFPGTASQWGHLFVVALAPDEPPAPIVAPWAVGIAVVAGETVLSHEGRLWRAKVSHTTHTGWVPSAAAYAIWEDIGPA